MHIISRDNSLLRQARRVRDGKVTELIFIEGLRLADEAVLSGLEIEATIFSDEIARKERVTSTLEHLETVSARTATVSEKLLESISYTKTPQGIVVLARRPQVGKEQLNATAENATLLVVLHQINNPVNVGAILRTAEAAGASGVITTRKTSDPFSPKSLRGAMGSAFRLPIWSGSEYLEVIEWCRARKFRILCAAATGNVPYTDLDWRKRTVVVLGPESTGLTDDEIAQADQSVSIPMAGSAESLNVSVAAGILLFEAARQRRLMS
jgi:RNA methyltransferase, TrmH family